MTQFKALGVKFHEVFLILLVVVAVVRVVRGFVCLDRLVC